MSGADPDRVSDRIMGLEEAALFAERRIDELHEQVLALSGRLEMLARRFERLERAVGELRSGENPGMAGEVEDEVGGGGPEFDDRQAR